MMTLKLELKIKDKVIKLTEEEARELGETLATMFDLKKTEYIGWPTYPTYPQPVVTWRYFCNDSSGSYTYDISKDVTATYQITA
jgi:hypothetical protein